MIVAQIVLVLLHGPTGHEILVNPREVTALHAKMPGQKSEHFAAGVNCMVSTSDGKFLTVIESCNEVARMLQAPRKWP